MVTRIYLPSTGASEWRRLLADPEKHWRHGYSAKAAADRWEAADGLPVEIERQFVAAQLGPCELLLALPEFKTPLPGGGRASQTDVFTLVSTNRGVFACGIEAKVAESFGPTVEDWLKDTSPGKIERLAFLCRLLGLPDSPPLTLRYQLLHRTAAALIEAKRFGCAGAAMLVHSFSKDRMWFADFKAFATALGATVALDAPALIAAPNGLPLLLGWACGPIT